ncbi:MAG: peptidase signal peptidase [Marmoricola sp.]|nr:peptidase signal peptidase [Marmoricola sp.]
MQAARGASLSPSGPADPGANSAEATPHPSRLALLVTVAVLAWLVDLGAKILAVQKLTDHPPVRVVGDLFQLELARNPGAAFSTGTSYTLLLSLVAIAAVVVILWLAPRVRSTLWAIALGVLLAGVCGNLTDRIFREPGPLRGHVVDFMALPHWPIFNVADVCINIAAVLILIQAARGVRLNGTVPTSSTTEGSSTTGDSSTTGASDDQSDFPT